MKASLQVAAAVVLAVPGFAQSLVEPERSAAVARLFDTPPSTPSLRCEISPMNPTLNFAFRFEVVYRVQVPMSQFQGPGHSLTTYTRVIPEGRNAVYLAKTEALARTGEPDAFAEMLGAFVPGEGAYKAEVLVADDLDRTCRASWQFRARREGTERQLLPVTPPAAIEELVLDGAPPPGVKPGPRIARLTILIHASPLIPTRTELQPDDIQRTVDSLASILRELPARTVRVIAFNLDQRFTIFRAEEYDAVHAKELVDAMTQLDLGVVDAKLVRDRPAPMELLLGLVQAELQAPTPPDALILLGPRSRLRLEIPADVAGKRPTASTAIFNLQSQAGEIIPALRAIGAADPIERLVTRLKGQTIPIGTPHDLADAIHRMDSRIPKNAAPAAEPKTEPVSPTIVPPFLPTASEPGEPTEPHGDEDPVELLIQLRDRVTAQGGRIPNHTCVETIQRDVFALAAGPALKSCGALLDAARQRPAGASLKRQSTDWLRLDVAYSHAGREIYSWAGAGKFEEGEIDELVPEGAMGTGPYTTMLLSAFQKQSTKYVFDGESTLDGRRLFEYSFAVSREQSGYKVKAGNGWVITGYSGSLLLDPKRGELVRLAVRTEELPAETGTCETTTTLDYGMVELSGNGYLLPKVARQRFIGREGDEAENTISFSACRDFQAESKMNFDSPAQTPLQQPAASRAASDLPGGLPVSIELLTAVQFGKAAAGDAVEGRLAVPILDELGQTLFPKGTRLLGRLMRVETRYAPGAARTVVLRWETINAVPIALLPKRQRPEPNSVLRRRGTGFELPRPGESRYGIFNLPAGSSTLAAGVHSEWFTAKP
uniref:VWFA domain-containing protein n=1 Tax=Solibacter usitatus (strain Ellin6076) TaxID=234267 RepID=Q028Q4_SOLUE